MFDFSLPLFPGGRPCPPRPCGDDCRKIPVFSRSCPPRPTCDPQTVRLQNPQNPCESVLVTLSIDNCGNLVVCVKR